MTSADNLEIRTVAGSRRMAYIGGFRCPSFPLGAPAMDHRPPLSPHPKDQTLALAKAELAAGRLDRASTLCQRLLEADTDDVGVFGLAGVIALRAGRDELAMALLGRAVVLEPDRAEHHDNLGLALAVAGRPGEAVGCHRQAVRLSPDDPVFQRNLALTLNRLGRRREAGTILSGLLARYPAFPGALSGLASVRLPGDDYVSVLAQLHDILRPATYVEIGVETGATLALARPPTLAVGIDPALRVTHEFITATRLFGTTSDDFFAGYDLTAELNGQRVELAFIDGLHTFDQALKDFINLERHAAPSAVMVFHDVLPLDAISSARVRRSGFWTGDTWKILPALRRHRPDLELGMVPAAPSGLLVVRGLDPASSVLPQVYDRMVAELMPLTFADWQARNREFSPVTIPNRRAAVAEYIGRGNRL
jgi:tetratricopeptide (TPR) repeat protein